MTLKISCKDATNSLQRPWEGGNDSFDKWKTPVTDDLKKNVITEFKHLHAQISDAQETVAALTPRLNALQGLINSYGWTKEVEEIEQADDWQKFPDLAKPKGQKIAEFCHTYFAENGNQWTRLSDLFIYLTEKGITIGGKNPNSTLSAHLSNSNRFEGERARGWRLKSEFLPPKKVKII